MFSLGKKSQNNTPEPAQTLTCCSVTLPKKKNENGKYAMRLYPLGVPMTLQIDDYMPFNITTDDLAFAQVASDNALWGPLLEKGIAKLMGNYWHTD